MLKRLVAGALCLLLSPLPAFCAPPAGGQRAGQINALIPAATRNEQPTKAKDELDWNDLLKTAASGRLRAGVVGAGHMGQYHILALAELRSALAPRQRGPFLVAHGLRPEHVLLDIACGDAGQMKAALSGTKANHYHGIDLSEPALELAAKNLAGVPFEVELEGRVLDCNDAFARIFGYSAREEVIGRPAGDFYLSPEAHQATMGRLRESQQLANHEECLRRRDGTLVWILENGHIIEGVDGAPGMIEGTIIDITDRKRAENAARSLSGRILSLQDDERRRNRHDGNRRAWLPRPGDETSLRHYRH